MTRLVARVAGALLVACVLGTSRAAVGVAQPPAPVLLELRPRPGDHVRLRVDQTIEIGVTAPTGGEAGTTDVTSLVLLARLDVGEPQGDGVALWATADSVRIMHEGPYASVLLQRAQGLQGQRFRVLLAPDGATVVEGGDAWARAAVASLLSQVPGTLPHAAVTPGATWERRLEVPLASTPDAGAPAELTGTFRFDSLSRTGEFAYLSLRGRLQRRAERRGAGAGRPVETAGTVSAALLLDRRRGWVVDARSTVQLRSLLGADGAQRAPLRVRMLMTQWVRVL